MTEIILGSIVFSGFASNTIASFIFGHIYLPKSVDTIPNYHLWGKKTDPTHLTGMDARATSGLILLVLTFWFYAFVNSIEDFTNTELTYIVICSLIGSTIGLVLYEQMKRRWLHHQEQNQEANPIRIKRDY